jgi:hypothetical protein
MRKTFMETGAKDKLYFADFSLEKVSQNNACL